MRSALMYKYMLVFVVVRDLIKLIIFFGENNYEAPIYAIQLCYELLFW